MAVTCDWDTGPAPHARRGDGSGAMRAVTLRACRDSRRRWPRHPSACRRDPAGNTHGTVGGDSLTPAQKGFGILNAIGAILFAYSFSMILIEIQDTIKSAPKGGPIAPMKIAIRFSVALMTGFYMAVAIAGYMAFGDDVPSNILTGFSGPRWVVDWANIMVVIHMIPAYQVYSQPFLAFTEYHYNEWKYAPRWFKVRAPACGGVCVGGGRGKGEKGVCRSRPGRAQSGEWAERRRWQCPPVMMPSGPARTGTTHSWPPPNRTRGPRPHRAPRRRHLPEASPPSSPRAGHRLPPGVAHGLCGVHLLCGHLPAILWRHRWPHRRPG